MSQQLDFTGRVAIVTGAGRGIGRDTALGFARRGAKVLVNDYGGSRDTLRAGSIDVAQSVVDEIRAAGGEAVADATSVGAGASAATIVDHALAEFGRVDIVVNNAGGGTDGRVPDLSDDEVEGQIGSLLLGPFMLMRRAWPHMVAQRYGRIVNVMSAALLGVELHAAYCAAKAGLIGLTNSAAAEGAAHGIAVNGVWPVAGTRLNDELKHKDRDMYDRMMQFRPSQVAESMIFLGSEASEVNGEMFSVGGGRVARIGFYSGGGYVDRDLTAEELAANVDVLRDMDDAVLVTSAKQEVNRFPVAMPG